MKTYPAMHFKITTIPPNTLLTFKYNDYQTEGSVTGYLYVDGCGVPRFVDDSFICDKNTIYIKPINSAYNVPNNNVINAYNPHTNELEYVVCELNVYLSVCRYLGHVNNRHRVDVVKTAKSGYITVNDIPARIIINHYNKFNDFVLLREYLKKLRASAEALFIETAHKADSLKFK